METIIKETIDRIRTNGAVDIYDGSIDLLNEWMKDVESFEATSYGRGGSRWMKHQENLFVEVRNILTQVGHSSPGGWWMLDRDKIVNKDNQWVIPVKEMRA